MTGNTSSSVLEIVERRATSDQGRPPLLFVHGLGHGAWCWRPIPGHPAVTSLAAIERLDAMLDWLPKALGA